MVSPRRRFGSERIVILVGISALALAPLCADAALSYWPIRKRIRRPYATDRVEVYTEAATNKKWVFESDEATEIIADSAVVKNELDAGGHSSGGISARIKEVEDDLEALRIAYNAISFDTLNSASDDCDTKLTDFTNRVAALETAVASPAIIPVQCDAAGVAGLRRELNNGVLEWTCPCVFNYTDSGNIKCATAPCRLPADFDDFATSSIIQDCAEEYLAAGSTCAFSCHNKVPVGSSARTEFSFTCTAGTDMRSDGDLVCEDCTNNNTGTNCATDACTVPTTVRANENDHTCGQYLEVSDSCTFNCPENKMPDGLTTFGQSGTVICGTDSTVSGETTCIDCPDNRTDINCVKDSCSVTQTFLDSVQSQSCVGSILFMRAGDSCTFDCKADTMPGGGSRGSSGSISCPANGGTTSPQSPSCVDCSDNHTGINCGTDSCDLSSTGGLSNTSVTNVNCGSYLAADAQCEYECAADSEPTDTAPLENGNGRVVCNTAGSTASIIAGCKPCTDDYSGVNCRLAPCDTQSAAIGFQGTAVANNNVSPDSSCPSQYLKAGASCPFDCKDGYEPGIQPNSGSSRGEIECDDTGAGTVTGKSADGWCVACENERSGINCVTPSCDLSNFGYDTTAAAVVSSTCGLNEGYLKAGDSCEYSCADGYMPNTFTATNTARRIDCEKVDSTTVTTKAGTPATPANITVDANSALTCVTCDSAGFTNYTGNNCQTPSCLVNSVLSDTANVIDSTCGDSMKAGESCQYSCGDDSTQQVSTMPTGLNQATETGQSRTLTCDGGTITATGYTAGNDAPACTACTGGRTGINCVNAGS